MAAETEDKQLDLAVVTDGVRQLLEQPEAGFYLVAEENETVVGALMVTFEWSDWRNGFFWWLQSVYVRPEQRRRGVFRQLYERVQAMAESRPDVCGLRLYVDKHNAVGKATYQTLGMSETAYHVFELEFD